MQYCQACKIDYPGEKKFCRQCGTPLIDKPPDTAETLLTSLQCASCGREVASGKKFCRYCGAALDNVAPAKPSEVVTAQKLCPGCGTPITPGKGFCRNCGLNLAAFGDSGPSRPGPSATLAAEPAAGPTLVRDIAASVTPTASVQVEDRSAHPDLGRSEPGSIPVLTSAHAGSTGRGKEADNPFNS